MTRTEALTTSMATVTRRRQTLTAQRRRRRLRTIPIVLWSISMATAAKLADAWSSSPTTTAIAPNRLHSIGQRELQRQQRLLQYPSSSQPALSRSDHTSIPFPLSTKFRSSTNTVLHSTATTSLPYQGANDTIPIRPTVPPSYQEQQQNQQSLPLLPEHSQSHLFLKAPPSNVHILILPGFGTDENDYLKNDSLVPNLYKRQWKHTQIHVLPVKRYDWFVHTIFQGMILNHYNFMNGTITPLSLCYKWYLQRISKEIQSIVNENSNNKVILVGHSAGGWLARAAVGYGYEEWKKLINDENDTLSEQKVGTDKNTHKMRNSHCDKSIAIDIDNVLGIVTLGSPHLPSPTIKSQLCGGMETEKGITNSKKDEKDTEKKEKPKNLLSLMSNSSMMDITGGALRDTNTKFPGAYFHDKLFYITAVGNAVVSSASTKAQEKTHKAATASAAPSPAETKATTEKIAEKSSTRTAAAATPSSPTSTQFMIDQHHADRVRQMAYHSYKLVSGTGAASGDGVVPTHYAHLDGAIQINLDRVFHAANLSSCSTWYGSDGIIDQWLGCVMSLLL